MIGIVFHPKLFISFKFIRIVSSNLEIFALQRIRFCFTHASIQVTDHKYNVRNNRLQAEYSYKIVLLHAQHIKIPCIINECLTI